MESARKEFSEKLLRILRKAERVTSQRAFSSRVFMSAALLGSDAVALILSGWAALRIRSIIGEITWLEFLSIPENFDPTAYTRLVLILIPFLLVYASLSLYPTIGLNRVDEFRLLTISTSLVVTLLATILFLSQRGLTYSRFVFALFWLLALLLAPIGRILTRKLLVRLSLWGVPVGIVGSGPKTTWTADFLASHPNLGFKPTIVFDDEEGLKGDAEKSTKVDLGIRQYPDTKIILERLYTLVVIWDETPTHIIALLANQVNNSFPHIVIMPDLPEIGSIWVQPVDLGGVLALKIRNNLANPWQQFQKRVMDLVLAGIGSLVTLPLFGLIALAIKLDSPGPIFFTQERVGKGGPTFPILKFRTMHIDSEKRLQGILSEDLEREVEWERYQKLYNDPRVSRIGSFLRQLSLDELPQLWNILRGEMSLVGPRPFIPAQKERYGKHYKNYIQVRPGITGIWQVDGRNKTSFLQRAEMDEYYVRNWSIWLDLYILARTPIAVLSRDGAY